MKYECPHCNEKTITLRQKNFAGSLTSRGAECEKCKRRCVNGKDSIIVRLITSLASLLFITYMIFFTEIDMGFCIGVSILALIVSKILQMIYDAFFAKLIPSQWID